jgi:CheY-like chemotaxis protein/nitrogen-specific signal transduction histidine kinase
MNDETKVPVVENVPGATEQAKYILDLITAKNKAEEMNLLKSFFLANMSHELRTHLLGILGFSELLSNLTSDKDSSEIIRLINDSGKRLLSALDSILDLSRIEADKEEINWQMIDLNNFIIEMINPYEDIARAKGILISYINKAPEIFINTDTKMLEHIINALIDNAIKYTEHGEIEIRVEKLIQENVKWISIKIMDTGIGIDADKQKFLFEPYLQDSSGFGRSFDGNGLGLMIAKKFMNLLDGKIYLESASEDGSTFILRFPDHEESELISDSSPQPSKPKPQVETKEQDFLVLPKLLLVDDDPITRVMVQLMLQSLYDIEFAEDGKQAMLMIDETQYQIILMDINLRQNISGSDIVKLLRKSKRYSTTPIVAVTAYAMIGDREKFLAEGFTEYIPKPFAKNDLISVIKEIEKTL